MSPLTGRSAFRDYGGETNAYLHAGGALASIDGGDDALYLLNDALGSVRGVTDEAGDLDGTADYNVYGEVRASSGVSTLFRFTGEQHDAETSFTYLRARYANPVLGRFTSADTVQPNAPGTQGYNLYAYVGNNPTTWVDPSGHSASPSRALMSIYLANPGLMTVLVGACAGLAGGAVVANSISANGNGTLTRSSPLGGVAAGVCLNALFVGVTVPLLACALDPDCLWGAVQDADLVDKFGSLGPSDVPWDWGNLKDAVSNWPDRVFDPIESVFDSYRDWCIWLYTLCDDLNWTGDCDDCLHYCRAQQGRWPIALCHPQGWPDSAPSLYATNSFLMSTRYPLRVSYPRTAMHFSRCAKGVGL